MYTYIVDSFIQDKRFQKEFVHIQARLQDLGISGRYEKITLLKNIIGTVTDAERKKVETLVVIGNDKTFNSVVSCLKDSSITLGLIPVGDKNNAIAEMLHIPRGEAACAILSRRIIKRLDIGKVNGKFFFSCLEIPSSEDVSIECDNSYAIKLRAPQLVHIVNFASAHHIGNAQDGLLEAVVEDTHEKNLFSFMSKKPASHTSVLPVKKLTIKSGTAGLPITSEGSIMVKTPATIEIVPKRLRVIVGA